MTASIFLPPLNTMTVGMLRMPYSVATLGLSSVLSFSCGGGGRVEWHGYARYGGKWAQAPHMLLAHIPTPTP